MVDLVVGEISNIQAAVRPEGCTVIGEPCRKGGDHRAGHGVDLQYAVILRHKKSAAGNIDVRRVGADREVLTDHVEAVDLTIARPDDSEIAVGGAGNAGVFLVALGVGVDLHFTANRCAGRSKLLNVNAKSAAVLVVA